MEIPDLFLSPAPNGKIPWARIEALLGGHIFSMERTLQNPLWHGEGDVWTHTKLVCEALVRLKAYRELDAPKQQVLFLAALLHDIGKVPCTRLEDGQWTSPHHASTGAGMARQLLWLDWGLCGTPEKQAFRETVCQLIRYHAVPAHAIDDPEGKRRLLQIAANGALLPDFSVRLLCLLGEADALGRECAGQAHMLEQVQLCEELAREAGCYDGPYPFPSAYSRFCYLSGKRVSQDQPLYDDTWGQVILLSGLPGTGKDTWVRAHWANLPVISLDGIRKELGVSPTEPQGPVIEAARSRAKTYLRQKQPFVWNATNLTPTVRQKQLSLFHAYHASTKIIYLETDWQEQLRRNRERPDAVPEPAICRMLEILTPPEVSEAHRVTWQCV